MIIAITLCSCGSEASKESLKEDFSSAFLLTAAVESEGFTGEISFRRNGAESYELVFFAPESVAGQRVTVNGAETLLEFEGISSSRETAELHEKSLMRALMNAAAEAGQSDAEVKENAEGERVYTYESGVRITTLAGAVRRVFLPSGGYELKVSGFEKTE
jgi:hypothetical protein